MGAYRQRVLVAFAEVEDNLSGLSILPRQSEQVELSMVSARRSTELAQKLYETGRPRYIELFDAQRNLAQVERSAVQLRGERDHHGGSGASAGRGMELRQAVRRQAGGWSGSSLQQPSGA